MPCAGTIERLIVPGGFGVRFDSHVYSGYTIPPNYDSMIGKLLVHQPTRKEAIASMLRALGELRVDGIKTTIPLHEEILRHTSFVEGRVDTTFVERTFQQSSFALMNPRKFCMPIGTRVRYGTLFRNRSRHSTYFFSREGVSWSLRFAAIESCRKSKKLRLCFLQVAMAVHIRS